MATKPEHDPKNRTPKAWLKRAWNKSGVREVTDYIPYVINPVNKKFRHDPDALSYLSGVICMPIAFGLGAWNDYQIPEYIDQSQVVFPELDNSVSFSSNLLIEDGYIAVSDDNGRSGYALFNVGGDYRLYRASRISADETKLELLSDADEAWRISVRLERHFGRLDDAVSGELLTGLGTDWEVMTLPNLSLYAEDSDGDIVRFSGSMVDYDEQDGWSLIDQYSDVQQIWQVATQHFINHDASIPAEEFSLNAGVMSTETYQIPNPRYEREMEAVPWFYGVGGVLLTLGAIPPIVRRRNYLKNTMR